MIRRITYSVVSLLLACMLSLAATAGSTVPALESLHQLIAQHRSAIAAHQGALVLKKSTRVYLHDRAQVEASFYSAIAVTSDQAVDDYTQISIGFNSYYEEIQLDFARLVDADGNVFNVAEDAVQIQTQSRAATYDDIRQLVFSLPRLEKKSVLEFRYRIIVKKPVIDRYWFDRLSLQKAHYAKGSNNVRVDRVLESEIWVDAPQDLLLLHKIENANIQPKITRTSSRKHYRWVLQNIPEVTLESAMQSLSKVMPFVEISTIESWQEIDSWARSYYLQVWDPRATNKQLQQLPDMRTLSAIEKVRAIYYYVQQKIRYIEADFSRGGMIPHQPAQVLENRYGDCKDQAVLIATLLRFFGVTAYPALVSVYPDANVQLDVPSLNFSHAIVYVEIAGAPIFLDTSGDTGLFPGIDWSLEGAMAFVINGKGGELVALPRRLAADNEININVNYEFAVPDVQIQFSMAATGSIGNRYKTWLDANADAQAEVTEVLEQVFSGAVIAAVDIRNEKDASKPASIASEIVYKNAFRNFNEKISIEGSLGALVRSFTGTLPLIDPDKRVNDFVVNVPYRINYTARVLAPSNHHKSVVMQGGSDVSDGLLDLQHRYEEIAGNVELRYQFSLRRGKVDKGYYQRFYRSFETALLESQWAITFLFDNANYKKHELTQQGENVDAMVKLAKHHLSLGEYEDALSVGQRTIKLYPDHGGAHYVLGLSYGFMDKFDQSDLEIAKAKSLGFRP